MPKRAVIETHGLSKHYDAVRALNALDLQVRENSIFGFLGPNGAGKTTTMKLLLGLIEPTAGGGTVFGRDIVAESVEIRARVGYLPQDPRFYEHMTAREMLAFTARFFFKGPDSAIEERVGEMLALVGLTDKADRPIEGLSGGERQRVGIAQAQVSYPDLLILDEPAASLDPLGRRDVLQVMERLREHTTIFYSTHILDDVQKVSDTVAILNHGELVAHGPIEALLSGGDGVVYVVRLRGDLESAHARVAARPWVTEIQRRPLDGGAEWFVTISDPEVAERRLLRLLLADEGLVVGEFRRRAYELEDVFTSIVEGGSHVGQ